MKSLSCSECGTLIYLHENHESDLRRSHRTFFCPNGHSQYFPGKTEEQRKIEKLEREVHDLGKSLSKWMDLAEYYRCPNPRCEFKHKTKKRLRDHLITCGKPKLLAAHAGPSAYNSKVH